MNTINVNGKFWGLVASGLLFAVIGFLPSSALAADVPGNARSVTIHYADLNLQSDAGVEALYQRIHRAAVEVCRPLDGRMLQQGAAASACTMESMGRAVSTINLPQLTHEFMARGGRTERPAEMADAR